MVGDGGGRREEGEVGGSVGSMRLDGHEDSEPVRIEKKGRFGSERRGG
jgi:hypothetical protein